MFWLLCRFVQVQAVNAITASILWWVYIGLITLGPFLLTFPLIFCWDRLIMGYHGVNLLRLAIELDILSTIFVAVGAGLIVFEWLLCGVLFSEYPLRNFHYSEECLGLCIKHVFFAPFRSSLRWPEWFLLHFSARPFSGLYGEVAPPPFCFLPRLARLSSAHWVFLDFFPPSYTCSAISMRSNMPMYPCMAFFQNPTLVGMLVLLMS